MKKGEARKSAIIDAAERLFYQKGYENTSVQDVLDELNLSKGGFYHHFESKLSLLQAICARRAEESFQASEASVAACRGNAVEKFNLLFGLNSIFHQESMDFLALMIRVAYRDGAVMLRDEMKQVTIRLMLPLANEVIAEGIRDGLFYTRYPDRIALVLLQMMQDMTEVISVVVARAEETPGALEEILEQLEVYRASMEMLLGAPYASVLLFDIGQVDHVIRELSNPERLERWQVQEA